MSGHTPGPWSEREDIEIRAGDDGMPNASFLCSGSDEALAEARANWRLCVASTEMLAALREIVSLIDREGPASKEWQAISDACDRGHAAIAKAEGR